MPEWGKKRRITVPVSQFELVTGRDVYRLQPFRRPSSDISVDNVSKPTVINLTDINNTEHNKMSP